MPTPIAAHGLVFITNAHGKAAPIYAIKPTASGDISLKEGESSNAHIAWSYMRDGGYMQTPIVYGDILYVCRDNGVLTAFDAKTGTRHYQARLGDGKTGFSASAVASGGRLYFTSEDGDVYVVKAGPAYELLATNPLGEVAMATPAISEGTLLFRTRNHLVAVGERNAIRRVWIGTWIVESMAHSSSVISIIVGRKPRRSNRRRARSFCAAVPSTTRGMPCSRSHSIAASSSASPMPPPRAASADQQVVDEAALVAQVLPRQRFDRRVDVTDDRALPLGDEHDRSVLVELRCQEARVARCIAAARFEETQSSKA